MIPSSTALNTVKFKCNIAELGKPEVRSWAPPYCLLTYTVAVRVDGFRVYGTLVHYLTPIANTYRYLRYGTH